MLKKVIVGVMAVGMALGMCSCGNDSTNAMCEADANMANIHSEYFDAVVLESGDAYKIIEDKNTGYVYLAVDGYQEAGIVRIK